MKKYLVIAELFAAAWLIRYGCTRVEKVHERARIEYAKQDPDAYFYSSLRRPQASPRPETYVVVRELDPIPGINNKRIKLRRKPDNQLCSALAPSNFQVVPGQEVKINQVFTAFAPFGAEMWIYILQQ